MVMFNHCVLVLKEFCCRQFLPVVEWIWKLKKKKNEKEMKLWEGTSLFVGMILSLVSFQCFWIDLYMQQGSFCSRWYVVSTSAEKNEKTIDDSYGEGKLFEYCRLFSDLLSIVKSFVNEHTNFKCLLKI